MEGATQIQHQPAMLPTALSPQEGILALSLLLGTQVLRLRESRRLARDGERDELSRLLQDKEELLWRLRSLLGGLDAWGYREGVMEAVVVKRLGLEARDVRHRRQVPGRLFKRRQLRQRLSELERTEARLRELATACRQHFADSLFKDEFRICSQVADDHLARLKSGTQAA